LSEGAGAVAQGSWDAEVDARLQTLDEAGRRRRIRTLAGTGPEFLLDGRAVVSFASNDYFGLSQHPAVVAAAKEAADRWGAGAGASRLVVGSRSVHDQLEAALTKWKGTAAALVFPTGYAANLSVLQVFGRGARIVSDELNHASIVDGCRLARAEVLTYKHADLDEAALLVEQAPAGRRVLLVTDSVFSMDGDAAPVAELSQLSARTGALLVLDDAHAVFAMPELDPDATVLRVGTLSKMLGSLGGFVAGPAAYIDLLLNSARPFIFTTAPAPPVAAAALAALQLLQGTEGAGLLLRLRSLADRMRPSAPSPIFPVVLGREDAALAAAGALLERGLLVPAIRPPTVPAGTSRLRVALSAAHTETQLSTLLAALEELGCTW
jgi:8-amino-7-oxononanoate synthase